MVDQDHTHISTYGGDWLKTDGETNVLNPQPLGFTKKCSFQNKLVEYLRASTLGMFIIYVNFNKNPDQKISENHI
jgi:hypothetical protein